MKWLARIGAVLAVSVLLVALLLSVNYAYERMGEKFTPPSPSTSRLAAAPAGALASLLDAQSALVAAAENVMPAVVSIETKQRFTIPGFRHPFADDPFFRQFFGDGGFSRPPREGVNQGLGSGVIVDTTGIVVTNHHVIDGADEIIVKLENGREYPAKVLGSDERLDVAVLKIEGEGAFVAAPLGNSDQLKVGMFVLAIGTPFKWNLSQTVTMGIISALGRSGLNIEPAENFIQTDAAINMGNSGGPLVNLNGEVVGINVAIVTGNGLEQGNVGIGFAIPINSARYSIDSIRAHGRVIRGYIGVGIQDINNDLMQSLGLESTRGAVITEVVENAPAHRAGLKAGDVILEWNGAEVRSASNLTEAVGRTDVGSTADLVYFRDGKRLSARIKVAERPANADEAEEPREREEPAAAESAIAKLGISVRLVEGAEAKRFNLPASGCLLITQVKPGSLAAEKGIPVGAGILEVDGRTVTDVAQLEQLLAPSGRHRILVRHQGRNSFVTVSF